MKSLILLQLLCIYMLYYVEAGYQRKWCHSCNDPHMVSTDGLAYEFQYAGDNFVLFSDFGAQHVTGSFRSCSGGPTPVCNCGFKFKFKDHYFVYDVCGINATGIAMPFIVIKPDPNPANPPIKQIQGCNNPVSAADETNDGWWNTPGNPNVDADNYFFCAKLNGLSDTYVIRSNAGNNDAIYVKVTITSCGISCIYVSPGPSQYLNPNSGGLCGKYNDLTTDDQTIWTNPGAGYTEVAATPLQMSTFWILNRNAPGIPNNPPAGLNFLKLYREECPCDAAASVSNSCDNLIAPCLAAYLGFPVISQNFVCGGGKETQGGGMRAAAAERTCRNIMGGVIDALVENKVLVQEKFDKLLGWCKLDLMANGNIQWAVQHAQTGQDWSFQVCDNLDLIARSCDELRNSKPAICQAADLFKFPLVDPIDIKRCAAFRG